MKPTSLFLIASVLTACDETGEWAGATVVYGTVSNATTGAIVQSELSGAATPYFTGCIHPAGGAEPFIVSNGRYRVLVPGGFGSYPGCAELRFRPTPSTGLDTLIVRTDALPTHDRRRGEIDSVRVDVSLPSR